MKDIYITTMLTMRGSDPHDYSYNGPDSGHLIFKRSIAQRTLMYDLGFPGPFVGPVTAGLIGHSATANIVRMIRKK